MLTKPRNFFMLPNRALGLAPHVLKALAVLARYRDNETGWTRISQIRIAEILGYTTENADSSVSRVLQPLKEAGLVRVIRGRSGVPSQYEITWDDEDDNPSAQEGTTPPLGTGGKAPTPPLGTGGKTDENASTPPPTSISTPPLERDLLYLDLKTTKRVSDSLFDQENLRETPRTITDSSKSRKTPKPRAPQKDALEGFEEFYTAYPRKVGRGAAERAWMSAIRSGATLETICSGLQWQIPKLREADPEFRPHPATWLNSKRYLDEPPAHLRPGYRQRMGSYEPPPKGGYDDPADDPGAMNGGF